MLRTSQWKYFFFLVLVISVLSTTYTIHDFIRYDKQRQNTSIEIGESVKENISYQVNSILGEIINKASTLADTLNIKRPKGNELLQLIENESKSMEQILGITIAFEPYHYSDTTRLYAPFYDKNIEKFVFIDQVYDYTDPTLSTSQWYVKVRNKGSQWVEPYYAEGARQMVCDYGTPFYFIDEETGEDKLAGTITMTISLKSFTKLLNSLSLGNTGYGFIISKLGNFVAHPISEYVSAKNILDVAREHQDDVLGSVARIMINKNSGNEEYLNRMTGQISYLFYKYLSNSDWSLGIVFIKNELLGSPVKLRKKTMHIVFSLSILLITLLILIFKFYQWKEKQLWSLVIISSLVITFNIGFIWFLTLNYPDTEEDQRFQIANKTSLSRFMNLEINRAVQTRTPLPIPIPTGIHVDEIEFEDSYNVNISGNIWQYYADSISENIATVVEFPQISPFAEALHLNELSRIVYNNGKLITWHFRGTFRLHFDYSTYPFDYRLIDIQLSHPDKKYNVILVPDLDGYKIVNPSSQPGVNKVITMPDSEIMASYFSYGFEQFNTNFGLDSFGERGEIPRLHFNILIKRAFINAFVTNIIPILIVALMVYFVIYSSSKIESKVAERSGISSFGVVESSAAFFFVLILAHIDLRKTVNTPVITYMETFYFIMYVILGLVVFNIVMFTKKDNYLFFDFKDNLIAKLIYWPSFLGLALIITIINFY